MKMKIEEVIAAAEAGKSLEGVVIENIEEVQVSVRDALTLARSGIVLPEQNVYYDDQTIAYDEDIDEVEWSDDYVQLSFSEKEKLVEEPKRVGASESITLDFPIQDQEVSQWVKDNRERVGQIIGELLTDLYRVSRGGGA